LGVDPVEDLLKDAKAPWYVRLGWRMKKGAIMQAVLAFFDAKFGAGWKRMAFGVVFCVLLVAQAVSLLFGIQIPILGQALTVVGVYLQAANPDAPVVLADVPEQVKTILVPLTTGVAALVALLQPVLRWWLNRQK